MRAGGGEINFVVNLERFARPVVCHFVFQANPVVPGTTDMSFAFHVEVVVRAGESDYAATAGAQPNQAVTAQRVNVDPKCTFTFDRRPPPLRPLPYPPMVSASSDFPKSIGLSRSLALNPVNVSELTCPHKFGQSGSYFATNFFDANFWRSIIQAPLVSIQGAASCNQRKIA
jgi:hypothetical protein